MKPHTPLSPTPADAAERRAVPPVVCYPTGTLAPPPMALYHRAREQARTVAQMTVPPRDARVWDVPAGHFCRVHSIEGPQVGDLNLWSASDLDERFYAGKTRALSGTHVSTGDRLWSTFPHLRPLA
ncbi:MAG: DUF1989 domain-containing protein, partial [Pseudomonadota bacterium]